MLIVITMLAMLLIVFILVVMRHHIIDSHKENKAVWAGFYGSLAALYVAFSITTDILMLTVIIGVIAAGFIGLAYLAFTKAMLARKYNSPNPDKQEAQYLQVANSKFITTPLALAITHDYLNAPDAVGLEAVKAVVANKHTPKKALKHILTLNLPSKVFVSLAGNPKADADILTVLSVKANMTDDVFEGILNNKNTPTATVRAIISMLDDPYSLIDGSSPQGKIAEKAITLLKERNPELSDIDDRYIIASCSHLF